MQFAISLLRISLNTFKSTIRKYHCKSSEIAGEVYEKKKYMNKICNPKHEKMINNTIPARAK